MTRGFDATGDFDDFCRAVHPRLVRAMTLYCGDAEAAEDFAQEALARAFRDWATVSQLDAPEAWAQRVAMNLAHSWYRRARLAWRQPAVTQVAASMDDRMAIRSALAVLPHRQRQAIVLRYFLDWSVARSAEVMGCAEGTVRALTSQGLASLRAAIGDDWKEPADD